MTRQEKQRRKMQSQSEQLYRLKKDRNWPWRYEDDAVGQTESQMDAQTAANELGFAVCEMFSWYNAIPAPNHHWITSRLFAMGHVNGLGKNNCHVGFTAWPKEMVV